MHISRWVTSHGFALNVDTDLSYFQYIVPCGLTKPVTSMPELGVRATLRSRARFWPRHFGRIFDCEMLDAGEPACIAKERTDMIDVVMPQMGESIVEGTLTKWLKKPGERVERDEPLFEISTDKVDTEIPSPAAGTLSRYPGAGRTDRRHQHGGRADRRRRRSGRASPPPQHRRRSQPPRRQPAAAAATACRTARPAATAQPARRTARRRRPADAAPERAERPGRARRSAVAAGAQDGAREQYRSQPA